MCCFAVRCQSGLASARTCMHEADALDGLASHTASLLCIWLHELVTCTSLLTCGGRPSPSMPAASRTAWQPGSVHTTG